MKRNHSLTFTPIIGILFFLALSAPPAGGSLGSKKSQLEALTEKVEKVITKASDMFEKGAIKKGTPYIVRIAPDLTLTFAAETFDQDLEKAFAILDDLMTRAKKVASPKHVQDISPSRQTKRSQPVPSPPSSVKKSSQPSDRITALRQAESRHPRRRPLTAKEVPIQYSAYKSYSALHKGRQEQEDKAAEADMQIVNRERQLAEQELQQRRAQQQQLQLQAMKWQAELDREAAESARKQAAYEAEHSFGAYVKRFFTTVLQTAVGSFTGAFIGNIGSHLADKAVGSLFHLPSDSPAAAGVSAAINSAAGSTGQTVSSGITSAVSGGSRTPSTSQPITPSRSWKKSSARNRPRANRSSEPSRPRGIWAQDPNWTSKGAFYGIGKHNSKSRNTSPPIVKCGTPYLQRHYRPIRKKVRY